MSKSAKRVLIALGSNATSSAGEPLETVKSGVLALEAQGWRILAVSRFFATPCFPAGAGDDYVNAAVALEPAGDSSAQALLNCLHQIEADHGRERVQRWGQRSLDLDLIAWGDHIAPDRATFDRWMTLPPDRQAQVAPDQLILPHPRVQDRSFALVPLADVAADWVHPVLGQSVAQMLAARPEEERAEVRVLE